VSSRGKALGVAWPAKETNRPGRGGALPADHATYAHSDQLLLFILSFSGSPITPQIKVESGSLSFSLPLLLSFLS